MVTHDLIVVGAGPFGLIAASTWLKLHPDHGVLIFESGPDVGGVWAKSRVYKTMMTQSPVGMFEYTSFPMSPPPASETFYGLFPGSHVSSYLNDFSASEQFSGKTLSERIHFNSKVVKVSKSPTTKLWEIKIEKGEEEVFVAKKVIMATGLTSTPYIPNFPQKSFSGKIIHSLNLASSLPLLSSQGTKHILIIGSSKSAFDTLSLLLSINENEEKEGRSKKKISWIVRNPAILSPPDAPPPLKNSHEVLSLRFISKTSPCIYEPSDRLTRFFFKNWFGRKVLSFIWWGTDWLWRKQIGYKNVKELGVLEPEKKTFWNGDGVAVCNSKGLWEGVGFCDEVVRGEVEVLRGGEVVMRDGTVFERVDVVVCATGWRSGFGMFEEEVRKQLGIPIPVAPEQIDDGAKRKNVIEIENAEWKERLKRADLKVLDRFPILTNPPVYSDSARVRVKSTPNLMFRAMVPIPKDEGDKRDLAFVGAIGTTQSLTVAEIQALWVCSWLDGRMEVEGGRDKMCEAVAESVAWRRRRYLGDGNTILFEQLQYQSMLIRDLGLNDLRKGGGWKELFSPYRCEEYKGILEEWIEKEGIA